MDVARDSRLTVVLVYYNHFHPFGSALTTGASCSSNPFAAIGLFAMVLLASRYGVVPNHLQPPAAILQRSANHRPCQNRHASHRFATTQRTWAVDKEQSRRAAAAVKGRPSAFFSLRCHLSSFDMAPVLAHAGPPNLERAISTGLRVPSTTGRACTAVTGDKRAGAAPVTTICSGGSCLRFGINHQNDSGLAIKLPVRQFVAFFQPSSAPPIYYLRGFLSHTIRQTSPDHQHRRRAQHDSPGWVMPLSQRAYYQLQFSTSYSAVYLLAFCLLYSIGVFTMPPFLWVRRFSALRVLWHMGSNVLPKLADRFIAFHSPQSSRAKRQRTRTAKPALRAAT